MKIRKANVLNEQTITNIYIYENKKEEYTVIAVPDIQWSFLARYEEETEVLQQRLLSSLNKGLSPQSAEQLTNKILHWIREM